MSLESGPLLDPEEGADEALARLMVTLGVIDAGVDAIMVTLRGACQMVNIAQRALESMGCDCGPGKCLRCETLEDMAAVATEHTP